MTDLMDRIEERITQSRINVIRFALYQNGAVEERTRVSSYPCSNCYSVSKSFTATAVGIASDLGLLSVDDPIVKHLGDCLPASHDPKLGEVQLRHLLTQTMGLGQGFLFEPDRYTHNTDDFIGLSLSAPLPHSPGNAFVYSNSTYYLLACIVEKVSGLPLDLFLRKHLFSPMDISAFAWERCPMGHAMGATGLYLSTRDILKLGILYLNGGEWEGRRLLSEDWVRTATRPDPLVTPEAPTGYSFWLNPEGGYRCAGANGQSVVVLPEKGLVFAAHSYTDQDPYSLFMSCL